MPGHAPRIPTEPQRNLSMTCRTVIYVLIKGYISCIILHSQHYLIVHVCVHLCTTFTGHSRTVQHTSSSKTCRLESIVYSYKNIIERTCCQHPIADSHIHTEGIVPCLYRSAGRRRSVLAHSLAMNR